MLTKVALITLGLFVTGFIGAACSIAVRRDRAPAVIIFVTTALSATIWLYQSKDKSMSMTQASLLFDLMYGAGYFVGFMVAGEAARWQDLVGLLLGLAGMLITFI